MVTKLYQQSAKLLTFNISIFFLQTPAVYTIGWVKSANSMPGDEKGKGRA
jgi:hypothetical protein